MPSFNLQQLTTNKKALAAVGIGGSVIAVCGGFFAMAMATVGILGHTVVTASDAKPEPIVQKSQTEAPPRSDDPAMRAVQVFMGKIRDGQWEQAWSLTTRDNQARMTDEDFRKQMSRTPGLQNFRSYSISTRAQQTRNTRTWNVKIELADGQEAIFLLEIFADEEGWRVNRFEK